MIYFTGDVHGNIAHLTRNYKLKQLTKDDYLIICGDFGFVWNQKVSPCELYNFDILDSRPYKILFVDGNHENFNRLEAFPVTKWMGGNIHKISKNVYHLMRGEIYNIDGLSILAMGGAKSHDISDGVLDPIGWKHEAKRLELQNKYFYRVRDLSWWEHELPTKEEYENCRKNVVAHNNKVDIIVTHCTASSQQYRYIDSRFAFDHLTDFLDELLNMCEYQYHIFGHYHMNNFIPPKDYILYTEVLSLDEIKEYKS